MSIELAKMLPKKDYPAATVKLLQAELDAAGITELEQVGNIPVSVRTSHGVDLEKLTQDILAHATVQAKAPAEAGEEDK